MTLRDPTSAVLLHKIRAKSVANPSEYPNPRAKQPIISCPGVHSAGATPHRRNRRGSHIPEQALNPERRLTGRRRAAAPIAPVAPAGSRCAAGTPDPPPCRPGRAAAAPARWRSRSAPRPPWCRRSADGRPTTSCNASAMRARLPPTWPARSVSHCATALRDTPTTCASSSWVRPASSRAARIRAPALVGVWRGALLMPGERYVSNANRARGVVQVKSERSALRDRHGKADRTHA